MEGSEGYGKVGSDYYYSATGNITNFEGTALYYQDAAHKHAVTHVGGTAAGNQKYWYDPNGSAWRRIEMARPDKRCGRSKNTKGGWSGRIIASAPAASLLTTGKSPLGQVVYYCAT